MESVRVRLEFKRRGVLAESQLTEGLRRTWLLLKPEIECISDLAAYLLHTFNLQESCPNGLVLSMDGFVLPPFESTCILKDKDIICVRRKGDTAVDTIKAGEGLDSLGEKENAEKQLVLKGVKLLANEEFEKECGEYADDVQECTVSRKRKASEKLLSSKRKKNKVVTTHKCLVVTEDDQNDVHVKENGGLHHRRVSPKKSVRKHKSSKLSSERDELSALESDEISNDTTKSTPHAKRFCQLQENGEESVDVSHKPGETKKIPSRSARRKKAKRRWLREQVKVEKKKLLQGHTLKKDDEQSPVKGNQKVFEEHQQPDENSDEEDDIVPVVIKPGHIRFERLGKDRAIQQNQIPTENLQWHGITSKKKGQKWGIEKVASYKRNEWTSLNQESSEMLATEIETIANNPIDFDKLTPYTSVPKKGDVVAYRLIELSSSWTPELSAFRVGKISHYDPVSNRIKLVTVPEYPIDFEKIAEEQSAAQADTSLYGEDGSLKINYSSLLHIRIVKHGNLDSSAKPVTGGVNEVPVDNGTALSGFSISNNNKETPAPARENGEVNAWDEISEALNAKKSQLSQEDGWSKEESSGKREWSYRAMRGSALGPTMALLRAQNEL
ncbi:coilin isoform X2 [Corylus avellana]|uniref:coilin isoform X2 n=1 Tax=Corylus avellana TaxID=13451 RepID=UPI00286CD78F|nr:coilin isoform X2 [Corylus avellana]